MIHLSNFSKITADLLIVVRVHVEPATLFGQADKRMVLKCAMDS